MESAYVIVSHTSFACARILSVLECLDSLAHDRIHLQTSWMETPEKRKADALVSVSGFAFHIQDAIRNTPAESVSRSRIVDRYTLDTPALRVIPSLRRTEPPHACAKLCSSCSLSFTWQFEHMLLPVP